MKYLNIFFIASIFLVLHSCSKDIEHQEDKQLNYLEAEGRDICIENSLPPCPRVDFTYDEGDCCTYNYTVAFIGDCPPLIKINDIKFIDYQYEDENTITFSIELCHGRETILDIIGIGLLGNPVVCYSKDITCNSCCASTNLGVTGVRQNDECCFYTIEAENFSECEYQLWYEFTTFLPGDSQTLEVEHCADNALVTELIFVDTDWKGSCEPLHLQCELCCESGFILELAENAKPSTKQGCCIWTIITRTSLGCNLEMWVDGTFYKDVPNGSSPSEVEICGYSDSILDIVKSTAEGDVVCLSLELENDCSE